MQKMTLHRALSELKLIDAKIKKLTEEIVPSGVYQKGKLINGIVTEEDFKKAAQSKFDSVTALIERKTKIKSAIVEANAKTLVTVAGKSMTIADAITYKSVIVFKKTLIAVLKQKHNLAVGLFNKNNEIINVNVQKLLEAALGKEKAQTDKDAVEAISKPFLAANEYLLFDPLEIQKKIDKMEEEVGNFEAEVDSVLSEINAVTFIGEEEKKESDLPELEF